MSPNKKGSAATMWWGTDGMLSGTLANALVENVRFTPNATKEVVEDNTGFETGSTLLDDGWDAEVSCQWKSGITWPAIGDTVLLKYAGDNSGKSCLVEEAPPADAERKKHATLKFKLSYRPNRTL